MSIIRDYETKVARAAEYERHGMHEHARELRAEAARLAPAYEAERAALRARVSPLAAIADAAAAARTSETPAWQPEAMTPERQAQRAALRREAIASNGHTEADARRWREAQERENERLRHGGR